MFERRRVISNSWEDCISIQTSKKQKRAVSIKNQSETRFVSIKSLIHMIIHWWHLLFIPNINPRRITIQCVQFWLRLDSIFYMENKGNWTMIWISLGIHWINLFRWHFVLFRLALCMLTSWWLLIFSYEKWCF